MTFLSEKQRKDILARVRKRVLDNHFNVAGIDYKQWASRFDDASVALISDDLQRFEAGIQELLKELRSSHTGFYPSAQVDYSRSTQSVQRWGNGIEPINRVGSFSMSLKAVLRIKRALDLDSSCRKPMQLDMLPRYAAFQDRYNSQADDL